MPFFKTKDLQSNPFINWLELFVVLFLLWIILSEKFETKFIIVGLLSSLAISLYYLNSMTLSGVKTDRRYFIININYFKFLIYAFWLLKEIIKSALYVSKIIVTSNSRLQSQIVYFQADYDNPVARALLTNSITLTPSTVTVDIFTNGTFSVHCLTDRARDNLLDGTMQRKIAELYNEDIDYKIIKMEHYEKLHDRPVARLLPKKIKKRKV